ncbi:MAG: hypothetical protein DLD55_00440 [candidate division SR1 bacterium]|nr:MAG: hypothetical protein DLD55_00440 [candidate division SR1 bacterium]
MKKGIALLLLFVIAGCSTPSQTTPESPSEKITTQNELTGTSEMSSFPLLQKQKIGENFNDFTLTSYKEEDNSVHFILEGEKKLKGKLSYSEFADNYYFISDEEQILGIKIDELEPQREEIAGDVEYSLNILQGELAEESSIDTSKIKELKAGTELPVELTITKIEHSGYYYSEYHNILSIRELRFLQQ